jgi:hypothetical protein
MDEQADTSIGPEEKKYEGRHRSRRGDNIKTDLT